MVPKGWIELTQLSGNALTISIQQIVCVRVPIKDEVPHAAQSVVEFVNGKFQAVTETRDTVIQRIADSES